MNELQPNLKPIMHKYNINQQIELQPRGVTIEKIVEILEADHDISRSTFNRDRNIPQNSTKSIPSDRLDIYAALFGVTSEQLKNYTVDVRPLSDREPSELMKKVIDRARLKK